MSSVQAFSPAVNIGNLLDSPEVQRVFKFIDSHLEKITEEQIRICSIPAPPFGEKERAEYLRERFLESGLADAKIAMKKETALRCEEVTRPRQF